MSKSEILFNEKCSICNFEVKHYKKRPFEELYDLENDPFEKNNIADQPKYFGIKNDLEIKLKVWMEQQGDLGIETNCTYDC